MKASKNNNLPRYINSHFSPLFGGLVDWLVGFIRDTEKCFKPCRYDAVFMFILKRRR